MATVYFLVVPLLTLAHELGHAIPNLVFAGGTVRVVVGSEDGFQASVGRLELVVDHRGWRTSWFGVCRWTERPGTPVNRTVTLLAGPAVSLCLLATIIALIRFASGWVQFGLYAAFWWTLTTFVVTLVPMRYPSWWGEYGGMTSDGYKAWRALADDGAG